MKEDLNTWLFLVPRVTLAITNYLSCELKKLNCQVVHRKYHKSVTAANLFNMRGSVVGFLCETGRYCSKCGRRWMNIPWTI
mgnify:CR=1 FL=1